MKKLTCEMCGCTDFVKQDGVFVCQSCGLKYSTEDAKKMVEDGEESGAVVVASESPADAKLGKLDNLYQLARRAKDGNDSEKAAEYYEQILLDDPNSWEATFYSVCYTAIKKYYNDERTSAVNLLTNNMTIVTGLIKAADDLNAIDEVVGQIDGLCNAFCGENERRWEAFYKKFMSYDASSHNNDVFKQVNKQKSVLYFDIAHIYCALAKGALGNGFDDELVRQLLRKSSSVANKDYCNSHQGSWEVRSAGWKKTHDAVLKELEKKEKSAAKRRFDDYWAAHQSEKTSFESEKKSLADQIVSAEREIPNIPGHSHITELWKKINGLESEKKSLGIFKIKEKKSVQTQIEAVHTEIHSLQKTIDTAISEIMSRISQLQGKIKNIDTELTKPR